MAVWSEFSLVSRKEARESSSKQGPDFMNNLSDAVLFEILHRLPFRFAVQCKSISKRWLSIISQTYFVRSFIHRHHQFGLGNSFVLVQP